MKAYLLHRHDTFQIIKLYTEERGKTDFLCNLRMRITSDSCNKYEQIPKAKTEIEC